MSQMKFMTTRVARGWIIAALLILASILSGTTATAQDAVPDLTLKKAVADIARAVADVVKAQNTRDLVVGLFNDNADPNHAFGAGLRNLLINQLRAEGITPVANADIRFFGNYEVGPAEIEGALKSFPVAKVAFTLQRRNKKVLLDSEKDLPLDRQPRVTNPDDLARMSGQTGFAPPRATAAERFKTFFESEKGDPNLFEIKGTQIRPRNGSEVAPYAVEMLAARFSGDQKPDPKAYHLRKANPRDGRPFVKVETGEVLALRIINDDAHDVAVTITIDGLSLFAFRANKNDKSQHVIIPAHSAGDILGWFRDENVSNVFQVADLPEHPDSKLLKTPALIGAFTLTFAAAWEKDSQKPADEPASNQATEIVPGADIQAKYETVKRFIGAVRAAITVRYDKM
jgi:hypothetical protein